MFKEWLLKEEENGDFDEDGNPTPAQQIQWGLRSIASNSYRKTRPFKEEPSQVMGKYLNQVRGIRKAIINNQLPVDLKNLDLAAQALADSILDFRKTGGIFEPAKYVGGADPKSAETLDQFALFLHKRVRQQLVYGKQWQQFAQYWEAFMRDYDEAMERWKASR